MGFIIQLITGGAHIVRWFYYLNYYLEILETGLLFKTCGAAVGTIINHPPNDDVYVFLFTIPSHGWFMTLFYPHYITKSGNYPHCMTYIIVCLPTFIVCFDLIAVLLGLLGSAGRLHLASLHGDEEEAKALRLHRQWRFFGRDNDAGSCPPMLCLLVYKTHENWFVISTINIHKLSNSATAISQLGSLSASGAPSCEKAVEFGMPKNPQNYWLNFVRL